MKIQHVSDLIAQHLLSTYPTPSLEDAMVANVALHKCVNAPYYNNAYAHINLVQHSPNFIQISVPDKRSAALTKVLDPLQHLYASDFGDGSGLYEIELPSSTLSTLIQWSDLPLPIQQRAQQTIEVLPLQKIFNPTPTDLDQRAAISIVHANQNDIRDVVDEILGDNQDPLLKVSGIHYHDVPSVMNKASWFYWVAHNGDEVAGVVGGLKMSDADNMFRLSYVSVAPGFRQQGIAKQLYTAMLDFCAANELSLSRSSPAIMSREHPNITLAFDKIILNHSVPHLSKNALFFDLVVSELQAQNDWSTFCQLVKPICDAWLQDHPATTTEWSVNPMDKKRTFAKLKSLLPEQQAKQIPTPFM